MIPKKEAKVFLFPVEAPNSYKSLYPLNKSKYNKFIKKSLNIDAVLISRFKPIEYLQKSAW